MEEVEDLKSLGSKLLVLNPKLQTINEVKPTLAEKRSLGTYWVKTSPYASWKTLAEALYANGEEKAAVMAKQYLPKPKGLHILTS